MINSICTFVLPIYSSSAILCFKKNDCIYKCSSKGILQILLVLAPPVCLHQDFTWMHFWFFHFRTFIFKSYCTTWIFPYFYFLSTNISTWPILHSLAIFPLPTLHLILFSNQYVALRNKSFILTFNYWGDRFC